MEEKEPVCIKAQLVAKRQSDCYTVYVFMESFGEYVMCTKLPNWNTREINIGQEGYLSYKFVNAGKDKWYDKNEDKMKPYFYSANYFIDFVPISHVIDGNTIKSIDADITVD